MKTEEEDGGGGTIRDHRKGTPRYLPPLKDEIGTCHASRQHPGVMVLGMAVRLVLDELDVGASPATHRRMGTVDGHH